LRQVSVRLNDILADTLVLYALYKTHEWTLRGTGHNELARVAAAHAAKQAAHADRIAAHIRTLGGLSSADPRDLARRTDIAQPPLAGEALPAIRRRLQQAHDTIAVRAHHLALACVERGDNDSGMLMVATVRLNREQAEVYEHPGGTGESPLRATS